jgi:hypothetical protein
VDFWDLTKLLVRRWYVALPMLLISVVLTVLTVGQVKPDYVATSYVQLVAPVQGATKPGQASPEQRNPWLGQGLQTLGNAAIITVLDQTVVRELKAAGLSDSYTVEMGGTTPMISFEVVGSTEGQARETAEALVERFDQSVAKLQSDERVTAADAIRTRRLDQGTNVEESDSKVKRALVAVAGAGLLLTAAVTIGLDAWLRRRRRRRAEAPLPKPTPPVAGQVRRAPAEPIVVRTQPNGGDRVESDLPTTKISTTNGAAGAAAPANDGSSSTVFVEYQSSGGKEPDAIEARESAEPAKPDLPADATIVLPLSLPKKEHWPGAGKKKRP